MYIASDDLIGGRGDRYFLEPVCSFGSIRPSFNILSHLGPVMGPYCRVWRGLSLLCTDQFWSQDPGDPFEAYEAIFKANYLWCLLLYYFYIIVILTNINSSSRSMNACLNVNAS